MASGDFTLTVSLNGTTVTGRSESMSVTKSYSSVAESYHQEMSVRTAGADTVFTIGSASGGGTLADPVKAIIIKNLDSTNYVTVGLIDATAKAFYTKINAGGVLVLDDNEIDANASGGAFSAFSSLDTITAQFNTAIGKIEIIVIK
jgi:hypothetical protein